MADRDRCPPRTLVVGRGRMGRAVAEALASRLIPSWWATRDGAAAEDPAGGASGLPLECALARCDLLLLALPVPAAQEFVEAVLLPSRYDGVVVDVSNPDFSSSQPACGPGFTATLADLAPRCGVVKALNTVPAAMVGEPEVGGERICVPLAGEDRAAKQLVAIFLEMLGFEAVDVGGLDQAPALESLARLLARLGESLGAGHRIGLRIARLQPEGAALSAVP